MGVIWVAVLIMCAHVCMGAPSVKYDQRQEGDVNIRADLENFVILIIPTSNSGGMGLLDILSKSLPRKNAFKHLSRQGAKRPVAEDDNEHFIESKTAPYHVDISKTRAQLAKLHPINSDVLIAHSPTVALSRLGVPSRTKRTLNDALVMTSDLLIKKKVDKKAHRNGENLTLLGAEMDQCGPDQKRDSMGICQLIKP